MSGLNCDFEEFYQTSKTQNVIIDKQRTFDNDSIKLYCLEKDIDVNKEKQCLFNLCLKHGDGYNCSNSDIYFDTKKIYQINLHTFQLIFLLLVKRKLNLYFFIS